MAGHEHSQVRPQTSQDHAVIAAGSPLAIQGIFIEVIRERFVEGAGLDWVWNSDPTQTQVLIEADFNEEIESRSQTPAIYISRLQSTPRKVDVGDRAGVRLPDHLEGFSAIMDVDLAIECVSNDAGESSIIADIVQFMLIASQDVIQKHFGFYDFQHPIMGQTTPYPNAPETKWTTPITFQVSYWIRWSQVPVAPLLQSIAQRVTYRGPDTYVQSVLNSVRRGTTKDE